MPPTLAVLPFSDLSPSPETTWFARGFLEDLITELSRFPTLEVLHPQTSLAACSTPPATRYHLRGTVRRADATIRITTRLIDVDTGRPLWAERFDAPATDALAIQDEIAAQVAAALAVKIDTARLGRARRRPIASLEAYDCWLRGLSHLRRGTIADDAAARELFERALTLDPHYARAHAGISLSHFNEWSCQAWELWDEKERLAFEAAERAATLDDGDALVEIVLARIHLYRRAFAACEHHLERALGLNPNDADVLAQGALCAAYLGDGPRGVALADKAIRLNPLHDPWYLGCAALARFITREAAEGVALAEKAPRATVDLPAYVAGGYARLGDTERAAAHLATFLADFEEKVTFGRAPEAGEALRWLLHVNPFRRDEDAAYLIEGVRLAGLAADPDEGRTATRASAGAVFRREGAVRAIHFAGLAVRLTEVKGFGDLATLIVHPGEPMHCLELAGRPAEDAGAPTLDAPARHSLKARIRELQEELDDAEGAHDLGRAERARAELDQLVETMAGALGLGGRARRLGSPAERARSAVTWRIRSAIRKVGAAHPRLGRHLENAVRTGTYCTYAPESPVDWAV